MAVEGSIQVRNYVDKNDNKRQAVEVLVDQAYFADSKPPLPLPLLPMIFYGPPPPAPHSYGASAASAAPSFQSVPTAGFGYSSGAAEDFEEISEDEEDLHFSQKPHHPVFCIFSFKFLDIKFYGKRKNRKK